MLTLKDLTYHEICANINELLSLEVSLEGSVYLNLGEHSSMGFKSCFYDMIALYDTLSRRYMVTPSDAQSVFLTAQGSLLLVLGGLQRVPGMNHDQSRARQALYPFLQSL